MTSLPPWLSNRDKLLPGRFKVALASRLLRTCLFFVFLLLYGAAPARPVVKSGGEVLETTERIQVVEGRVSTSGLQLYRVIGLKKGEALFVHAKATSGYLDPLIALIKPDVDLDQLAKEPLEELVNRLSCDHDPIEVTRQLLDRYALVGSDDSQGHYYATFSVEIPADGDYWLAIGSSLVRPSEGTFRLAVGLNAPEVLSGRPESRGQAFVFAEKDAGVLERAVVSLAGELNSDQIIRFYYLAALAAGQTFYSFAEALDGDLKPVLTLYDHSDKPVAYGNFAATESRASLEYELPRTAERYRLSVSGLDPDNKATQGNYRLLMGLDAPEVLKGEGEQTRRELLREPIPVRIGIKLQQITGVDQKAENFGVVASIAMNWRDPSLAFDPETVQDRHQIYEGDAFSAEMSQRGQLWPQYTIVNQQGNRWVQNRLVMVRPEGEAFYLERFSTTLQAPDFDFRNFPFDVQRFFIRVDLLEPEWVFFARNRGLQRSRRKARRGGMGRHRFLHQLFQRVYPAEPRPAV